LAEFCRMTVLVPASKNSRNTGHEQVAELSQRAGAFGPHTWLSCVARSRAGYDARHRDGR